MNAARFLAPVAALAAPGLASASAATADTGDGWRTEENYLAELHALFPPSHLLGSDSDLIASGHALCQDCEEDNYSPRFVHYRRAWHDTSEFFSGVVLRFPDPCEDAVVTGRYYVK